MYEKAGQLDKAVRPTGMRLRRVTCLRSPTWAALESNGKTEEARPAGAKR
jgi:hypothetical protein